MDSHRIDGPDEGRLTADDLARFRRPRPFWTRSRKVAAIVVAIVLLAAGVAWALLVLLAGTSGQVSQGDWQLQVHGGSRLATVDGGCTVTRVPDAHPGGVLDDVDLQWAGVANGDECSVVYVLHPKVGVTNSTPLVVQGFDTPAGLLADTSAACGVTIDPTDDAATAPDIPLTFSVEAGAPAVIDLDAAAHGLRLVRPLDFTGTC